MPTGAADLFRRPGQWNTAISRGDVACDTGIYIFHFMIII